MSIDNVKECFKNYKSDDKILKFDVCISSKQLIPNGGIHYE